MQGLILKDNAWHLIEELPEEPKPIKGDIGNLCYRALRRDYEYILQRAIDNAVRVENQETTDKIINAWALSHENFTFQPMNGEVYPVEVRYEIDYFDPFGERLARLLLRKEEGKDGPVTATGLAGRCQNHIRS
jgi:hypothetical protein